MPGKKTGQKLVSGQGER